jgi:hypothetical protein
MLKVFCIKKLMQNADINTLDSNNQLHPIFYLHQRFIASDESDAKFYCYFYLFPETNISFL